jgi:hypothetical protein
VSIFANESKQSIRDKASARMYKGFDEDELMYKTCLTKTYGNGSRFGSVLSEV